MSDVKSDTSTLLSGAPMMDWKDFYIVSIG